MSQPPEQPHGSGPHQPQRGAGPPPQSGPPGPPGWQQQRPDQQPSGQWPPHGHEQPSGQPPPGQGAPPGQWPQQGPPPGYPPQPPYGQVPYGHPQQPYYGPQSGASPFAPGGFPPGPGDRSPRRSSKLPWILGGVGAVVLVLISALVLVLVLGKETGPHPGLAAGRVEPGDVEGVQTFDDLSLDHVSGTVDYPQNPPAGGPHNEKWLNCGIYDAPVPAENAVHSLEHAAVWITYDAALDQDQVQALHSRYYPGSYLIISPVEGLPAPVVASAWGKQLGLDDATDPRLDAFINAYEMSMNAPEPDAPCSGMVGNPVR
ncbi:DUF3105 domain-containing protein [Nocardiopsis ansamitocini]|uniref:DUF3105 domain-containing protein n=1 Tax=Nocardiopsis ansamitocini TaxID=1670832 RepID=A0A9W6P546_9ACTN|nr:DUF3105 domain-containing protein [Nocardiopsis ansamitocini]GLU47385.1 hypothetical protein Nans01_17360 [Nocardiopsis ansamitocini]